MGLRSYPRFQALYREKHMPQWMGFRGHAGDITRLSNRVRLARSFRGIELDGYSRPTVLGYNAFFQVFLTHSALERYLDLIGLKLDTLEDLFRPRGAGEVVAAFFESDHGGRLFRFLHERVNDRLKVKLSACRDGGSCNVGQISASVRHIFAHGHLTAQSNGVNPRRAYASCKGVSDFLLDFIDDHFEVKLDDYCRRKQIQG
jgi:hypothetical protein